MVKWPFTIPNKISKVKGPVVVVEIGNDWLKVIEGNPSLGKEGMITKEVFKKLVEIKEPVTVALVKIFKDFKLNKLGVIACIPRHLLTVRILEFPSTNPKDIRDMVSLQVSKQTPYSKDEIIFTYKAINVTREGYTKVMLIIARRNLVNARVEVLQKAGIEVSRVTVSSEGLAHWFRLAYWPEVNPEKIKVYDDVKVENQAVVFVDIDSNYSDLIILLGAQLVYTRNFLIGANHLLGEEPGWFDKFNEEIVHSIGLYQNEERDVKIVKLFVGGTAWCIPNLISSIGSKIEIPAAVAEPSHHIHFSRAVKQPDKAKQDEKFISPCPLIGIALASEKLELDLTSSELRIKRQMETRREKITVTGILAISILMLLSTLFLVIYYKKNNYMSQLKIKIAGMEKDATAVERMRAAIYLVKNRLDARRSSLNIFNEVVRLTPKEINFTSINIEEAKQTVLQGRASAMSNVFEFVTTLENSPFFEKVKTTYTTTKKEKDTEYAKFEIICIHEKNESEQGM